MEWFLCVLLTVRILPICKKYTCHMIPISPWKIPYLLVFFSKWMTNTLFIDSHSHNGNVWLRAHKNTINFVKHLLLRIKQEILLLEWWWVHYGSKYSSSMDVYVYPNYVKMLIRGTFRVTMYNEISLLFVFLLYDNSTILMLLLFICDLMICVFSHLACGMLLCTEK